jgi:hypothetical protein
VEGALAALQQRLHQLAPPELAGLCRCLWGLGLVPGPDFMRAVAAAAAGDATVGQASSSGAGAGATDFSGRPAEQGQEAEWDPESLSLLVAALSGWGLHTHPELRAARAWCEQRAAAAMATADDASLLRLAMLQPDAGTGGQAWRSQVAAAMRPLLVAAGCASAGSAARRQLPAVLLLLQETLCMEGETLPPASFMQAYWEAAAAAAADDGLPASMAAMCLGLAGLYVALPQVPAGLQPTTQQCQQLLVCGYRARQEAATEHLRALAEAADFLQLDQPGKVGANLAAAMDAAGDRPSDLPALARAFKQHLCLAVSEEWLARCLG